MTPAPAVVEAARECPLLARARAVAAFVGAGRPVTAKAVLSRADIPRWPIPARICIPKVTHHRGLEKKKARHSK
jgi:hypothetical protein